MKINKIVVLVELEEGKVHQVLVSKHVLTVALKLMEDKEGVLRLSPAVEGIVFTTTKP